MAKQSPYTMAIDSKDGKQRIAEVKRSGSLSVNMDRVREVSKRILSEKGRNDICFFWMFAMHDFAVMNKQEMDTQMRDHGDMIVQPMPFISVMR